MSNEIINTEVPRVVANFRANADIENFYRFLYENDLRREAKTIFAKIQNQSPSKKKSKKKKAASIQ